MTSDAPSEKNCASGTLMPGTDSGMRNHEVISSLIS